MLPKEKPKRTTYKERRRKQRAASRERRAIPDEMQMVLRIIDRRIENSDVKTLENLAYRFFLKSVEKMLRSMTADQPLPENLQGIFEIIRKFNLNAMDYGKIGAYLMERAQEKQKAAKKKSQLKKSTGLRSQKS